MNGRDKVMNAYVHECALICCMMHNGHSGLSPRDISASSVDISLTGGGIGPYVTTFMSEAR